MAETIDSVRSVSVVIPVRNEAAKIGACIDAILRQTVRVAEIVVVDSGSTDGTLEILARYAEVRVISIPASEFNHGHARNVGVREARGDWVVLTVGDASAADDTWIETLFAGVLDEKVVAVCGAQVVPRRRDSNPADWFYPANKPAVHRFQYATPNDFDALSPVEKLQACGWDDVTALYAREILLQFPFPEVNYAEDALWAKEALRSGLALVYHQGARVYHYHYENSDFTFRRTILALCFRYQAFGYVYPEPRIWIPFARLSLRILRYGDLSLADRVTWLRYNLKNQLAARSAIATFANALRAGRKEVEDLCEKYSGVIPIPAKTSVASAGPT